MRASSVAHRHHLLLHILLILLMGFTGLSVPAHGAAPALKSA